MIPDHPHVRIIAGHLSTHQEPRDVDAGSDAKIVDIRPSPPRILTNAEEPQAPRTNHPPSPAKHCQRYSHTYYYDSFSIYFK